MFLLSVCFVLRRWNHISLVFVLVGTNMVEFKWKQIMMEGIFQKEKVVLWKRLLQVSGSRSLSEHILTYWYISVGFETQYNLRKMNLKI